MTKELQNKDDSFDSDASLLEKVKRLPEKEKEEINSSIEMYSGPIPHPSILEKYDKLYEGAAKKMIDNGLNESSHRRNMEFKRQKRRGRLAFIALSSLIIISCLFIYLSFNLIMHNHVITGSVFGGASFLSLAGMLAQMVENLSHNDDLNANK